MIKKLKETGRLNLAIFLLAMSVFCFGLSLLRVFLSGTTTFLFMNWNLFLAFIPWAASSIIMVNERYRNNKIALTILLVIWLLFFPNSPYILTDLFHLHLRINSPLWFDLVVILSFAWTGLIFGFQSLLDIEELLSKYLKPMTINLITIVFLFIGSFGVYLGRYLRWNSWDVVRDPTDLMNAISMRFINPSAHPRTWGMTLFMGILLNMMFWSIKLMTRKKG